MYYVSSNRNELENYNRQVFDGEKYDGVHTTQWDQIIEHPNGSDFAILKHAKYTAPMELVDTLGNDWFPEGV
jgi:hypothetical protein